MEVMTKHETIVFSESKRTVVNEKLSNLDTIRSFGQVSNLKIQELDQRLEINESEVSGVTEKSEERLEQQKENIQDTEIKQMTRN